MVAMEVAEAEAVASEDEVDEAVRCGVAVVVVAVVVVCEEVEVLRG